MTALAPTLQAFFVSRLGRQRDASPHTVDSYRHAFRLLLAYAQTQAGKRPSEMDLADLDAVLVSGFPDHLEDDRGSSVPSRNTRLAAIHSFFRSSPLGAHRAALPGRRARHGSAPQVPRQGPQAPRHPARQSDGPASALVARRAAR